MRASVAAVQPVDMKSLEVRLQETTATGTLTKLQLKSQLDELLGQLRAYYQGRLNASLAELRQSYDTLVFKVLTLLQNRDPKLASTIAASREPIWVVLSSRAETDQR